MKIDETTKVTVSEDESVTAYNKTMPSSFSPNGSKFENPVTKAFSGRIFGKNCFVASPTTLTTTAIHIIAKRGNVSSRGDELFLYDDVEVLREASARQNELTLQTEYLHIIPDLDWAETDHPVTIVDVRNTVHAVGLAMDNQARTLKLLSQVRSVHVPSK